MAFEQSDLDKLERAIANGMTEVRYSDRTIKYRSLDEMVRARSFMMAELGKARPARRRSVAFDKGLE